MDFRSPVRRRASCFERNMSYMQQGIALMDEVRESGDLDTLHLHSTTAELYLFELNHYRTRCKDMSPEQRRAFDSKMTDFVTPYRLLLRAICRKN
ncbi:hypothetical protein FJZ21_00605 [Candidatus Pacearchaeota archaeon]|nr:hypothetical protein [Candidatus Pacearchaeota archaeon]